MDQFWDFLQILKGFMPNFIRIASVLHVKTQNSENFFQYVQNPTFFKTPPWNFKFFFIFSFSPLCMNEEKWKKSWDIKLGLRDTLEPRLQLSSKWTEPETLPPLVFQSARFNSSMIGARNHVSLRFYSATMHDNGTKNFVNSD